MSKVYYDVYENGNGDEVAVETRKDGSFYVEVCLQDECEYDKGFDNRKDLDTWLAANNFEYVGVNSYSV